MNKITVDVPMFWPTNGIAHIRITGPHLGNDSTHPEDYFKLGMFLKPNPGPQDEPEFYAEADWASIINLRNGLSAALFTREQN